MNNKSILFLFIFLILINSFPVNAFDLTSTELEKSVCPSSTTLFNANVFGSGTFNVNVDGDAAKWTVFVPQGFGLNNQNKLVYVYVTPKFDTSPGFYSLNLIVTNTENNEVKKLNFKVNVPDCHNLLITGTQSREICGCNSDTYNFTVSNNGIYQEAYKLEVTGKAAPWIKLSQYDLSLLPGQIKAIYGFLNAPCGSDFGENDFTVTIRSLTSKTVASFDSNVIVNSCFDFGVKLDKEFINMCEHSSEIIPININNAAQQDNEFVLSITGPAWANLHLTQLNLKSKESGVVNLILTPDYKVQGDFDVDLNIKSQQSKISKDLKLKVNVRTCNDLSFELLTKEDIVCVGSKKVYEANIKNQGELEKEFRIESSQGWAVPNPVILTLGAGQSRNVKLEFNPSENLTAQLYDIKFTALALDSSKISSEDSFKLDVISREQCYKPEVNIQNLEVNADSSATTPISIKNIGAQTAVYELGITGNANSFSQLNPSTITIEPGKTEILYLYVAPPYNTKPGDYKADVFVGLKGAGILESKEINIKVGEPGFELKLEPEKGVQSLKELWQKFVNSLKKLMPETIKEEVINLDKENKISKDVKFNFKDEIHDLKILEVKNNTVTIKIESDPVFVLLDFNETEEVDLDKDNKTDLVLILEGFDEQGNPVIKISKPSEVQEDTSEGNESVSEETEKTNYLSTVKEKLSQYKTVILVGVIIVLGLILFFATGLYKKLVNYLEEDEENEEEPLKIGRYILLIIILIVLFWYFRTYNKLSLVLNYLNTYKFYIIAGLIILILLILIINYWKQIIDFFEEDNHKRRKR